MITMIAGISVGVLILAFILSLAIISVIKDNKIKEHKEEEEKISKEYSPVFGSVLGGLAIGIAACGALIWWGDIVGEKYHFVKVHYDELIA